MNHKVRITNAIKRHIFADMTVYFQEVKVRNLAYHVDLDEPKGCVIHPFDMNDRTPLANRAFTAIAHKTFINNPIDSRDQVWTLKVYADAGRYRWEVWDSENPDYRQGQPRDSFYIEDIEHGFRMAMDTWRTKYANLKGS